RVRRPSGGTGARDVGAGGPGEQRRDESSDRGSGREAKGRDARRVAQDARRFCWQLGGVVGLDPRPFSLRQLLWMAEGKQSEAWNHTANLLATHWRIAAGKRGRNIKPSQFHPFAKGLKRRLSRDESRARLNEMVASYAKSKSAKSRQ